MAKEEISLEKTILAQMYALNALVRVLIQKNLRTIYKYYYILVNIVI